MCRLLAAKAGIPFDISQHLRRFSISSKNSKVYQGYGWGCSYLKDGKWNHYKNLNPIWEDNVDQFGKTTLLLAHVRSPFRNEGIVLENNMPFYDNTNVFIFNGELHGVTVKEKGRIGAEKIFNFIKRFHKGNMLDAMRKGIKILNKKSRYIKAMNIILSDSRDLYVATQFSVEPDYFTLYYKRSNGLIEICSGEYQTPVPISLSGTNSNEIKRSNFSHWYDQNGWKKIKNNSIKKF